MINQHGIMGLAATPDHPLLSSALLSLSQSLQPTAERNIEGEIRHLQSPLSVQQQTDLISFTDKFFNESLCTQENHAEVGITSPACGAKCQAKLNSTVRVISTAGLVVIVAILLVLCLVKMRRRAPLKDN